MNFVPCAGEPVYWLTIQTTESFPPARGDGVDVADAAASGDPERWLAVMRCAVER